MIEFQLTNKCLWCEEKEISMDKQICSVKCLEEMRQSAKEQGVYGKNFGFDMSDVEEKQ